MTIDAETLAALSDPLVRLVRLVEIELPDYTMRLWSGIGEFSYGGNTYTGAGGLGQIGAIASHAKLEVATVELRLTGLDTTLAAQVRDVDHQGSAVTISEVVLDANWQIIGAPITTFVGLVDTMAFAVEEGVSGPELAITCAVESYLRLLFRTTTRRRSDADHQQIFPGDKFLSWVTSLRKPIPWGAPAPATSNQDPAGSSGPGGIVDADAAARA